MTVMWDKQRPGRSELLPPIFDAMSILKPCDARQLARADVKRSQGSPDDRPDREIPVRGGALIRLGGLFKLKS